MRVLWTLLKVIIGLAIAIPVAFLALALTAGLVGTLIAFAVIALKLAIVGAIGYGLFRLARAVLAPSRSVAARTHSRVVRADPRPGSVLRRGRARARRRARRPTARLKRETSTASRHSFAVSIENRTAPKP